MSKAIYGYRSRLLEVRYFPYELMYGVPPHLVSSDKTVAHDTPVEGRLLDNISRVAIRAERALESEARREPQKKKEIYYRAGDQVLDSYRKAFNKISNWLAFQSVYYGP